MKRIVLSAMLGCFCIAGMAGAQAPDCPQDATAAGEALLARAEALEASGLNWDAVRDDTVAYGNACGGDFEAQFLAADTAWELAGHADAEATYELAAFVIYAIRRMEAVWMREEAVLGDGEPPEGFRQARAEQAGRIDIIVTHFIAPTVLRAIGEGRYFTGFDGPNETCPYQYDYLAQVEARALYDEIADILTSNPGDAMTFPFIPGDYRLMVLEARCGSVADDIRMIRGSLLTDLAMRAFENPEAPMPDGSAQPDGLAEMLVGEALKTLRAIETLADENRYLLENAEALEARIKDAPERLP